MFTVGLQMFNPYKPPAAASKLPDAPMRDQFETEEDYLEAKGRWGETVGRIKGMAARTGKGE